MYYSKGKKFFYFPSPASVYWIKILQNSLNGFVDLTISQSTFSNIYRQFKEIFLQQIYLYTNTQKHIYITI